MNRVVQTPSNTITANTSLKQTLKRLSHFKSNLPLVSVFIAIASFINPQEAAYFLS